MTWQGCGIECDPATSILSRVSATSHMPDFTPPKPTRQLSNRRLSGGSQGRNLSWRADDESENLIENDDQLERQQTAAAQQENVKRVAPSSFHGTPDHERRLQMYKVCVAMAIDNKVNLKNSWSLDFIDHMMDHMLEDGFAAADAMGLPNFQHAGISIDTGVKIFSCRVDDLYQLVCQVCPRPPYPPQTPSRSHSSSPSPDERPKPPDRRKPVHGQTYLEDNPSSLNMRKLDCVRDFEVNPIFERPRFDGAKGLLLNSLNVHQGTSLVFDTSDAQSPSDDAPLPSAPAPPVPTSVIAALLPKSLESLHVAKPFVDFWRPGPEPEPWPSPSPFESPSPSPSSSSLSSPWPSPGPGPSPSPEPDPEPSPSLSPVPVLDKGTQQQHWKWPPCPPKQRKPKAAFLVDFSKRAQIKAELEAAPLDIKGSTRMTAAARAKARATEINLPHDCHVSVNSLETLFDKPWPGTHPDSGPKPSPSPSPSPDPEPWPSPSPSPDPEPWPSPSPSPGPEPWPSPSPSPDPEPWPIDPPSKIAKTSIDYARRETQVDIKQLKADVWSLLQEAPEAGGGDKGAAAAGKVVSFQTVLSKLHEKVPAKALLGEISFAYCFICLLHLANEKGLEVLGEGGMQDMSVRMPAAATRAIG